MDGGSWNGGEAVGADAGPAQPMGGGIHHAQTIHGEAHLFFFHDGIKLFLFLSVDGIDQSAFMME